ncbi:hypothetical protein [Mangrovibacter plantisponsor]|uniref:DUF1640 domain-containing protein n=1 Tax=Mangrovibacter plantisponsor TaxID=451513 RepID=A0A317PUL1_9ENTR|nr:hypothetical protein [Mangrovibacter plantisponsor]PWW04617.1 hypothetical protein DES37_1155 [Mangrovibacter plantisponsor]
MSITPKITSVRVCRVKNHYPHQGSRDYFLQNLGLRVGKLEVDVADIRVNLAALTTRSEQFATKSDITELRGELRAEMGELREELRAEMGELREELRGEMGELREELRGEMGELREELRGEMAAMRGEINGFRGEFSGMLHKAIHKQTVLILTIVPASLAVVAGVSAWFS